LYTYKKINFSAAVKSARFTKTSHAVNNLLYLEYDSCFPVKFGLGVNAMSKRPFLLLIGFFLVLILICGGFFIFLNSAPLQPPFNTDEVSIENGEVLMEIIQGEGAGDVGRRLKDARLIKSRYFWSLICRIDTSYLKAGMYKFNTNLSSIEIHNVFVKGNLLLVKVTIPEGSTIKKIAAILEKHGVCSAQSFIDAAHNKSILEEFNIKADTMEGYLYPDTYYFNAVYPGEKVVRIMADTFYKELEKLNIDVNKISPKELHDNVILASIIEREYRIDEEAPIMAGVFLNRLKKNIRLESCATVEYIITEIEGKPHPTRLFNKDLERTNPYNTYAYYGLPPAPISSPGAIALSAAFNPQKNDYLFFRIVAQSEGRHYFSKNFDEHIKAGLLLLK
jgi:UPF0755 protein